MPLLLALYIDLSYIVQYWVPRVMVQYNSKPEVW